MKPLETTSLEDIIARYDDIRYQIHVAGLDGNIPVSGFRVLLRTVHAGGMVVEVYDADLGLQLFDPGRKTPVGWIIPNPLREEHKGEQNDA